MRTWYAGTLKGYRIETESGYQRKELPDKAMEGARTFAIDEIIGLSFTTWLIPITPSPDV